MKVVIIGGVAGGATAAARLRRLDEGAEIIMIERTGYVSYANCGLPYFIGGSITDRKKLTLQTPESFYARFRIDARVRQEVTKIDRAAKTVEIRKLETGETYEESYDKLILSPGARPAMPPLPGIDSARLFTLRTVEDTFAIADFIERENPRRATIVGAGFIGLEMAENLVERGIEVTVIQRPSHVMPTLDDDMAPLLHNQLRSHGIKLLLGANVTGFAQTPDGIVTHIDEHSDVNADFAILAIGVTPESTLAADAGLELGIKNAIKTDAHMLTNDPDIYAVGDAVEVAHLVTGEQAVISLAGPANKQGRIAADNICGIPSTFAGSQGSSVMKAFDMTVATTGLTARSARAAGIDFDAIVISPASHATYYPGGSAMTMKVLFEKGTGRILGAQIIGREGADKRIDVLAVAIKARMTAYDLTELDLAYAPPYSSAKDPVNMAGYVIENILEQRVEQCTWDDVERADEKTAIVDARTEAEFQRGHIDGAANIPLNDLRDRIDEVPAGKKLLVYCASGLRSYVACRILSQKGLPCANVAGGYGYYQAIKLDKNADSFEVGSCGQKA